MVRKNASILTQPVPILSLLLSLVLIAAAFVIAPMSPTSKGIRSLQGTKLANSSGVPGYLEVGSDGSIYSFSTPNLGGMGGHPLNQPIVGMAAMPNGLGYWEVASDGGIFTFGQAGFYGSMGGHPLNKPIVGMAYDPATGGYWEVASDGGIFSFNAPFYGSMGGKPLNQPIVGMAATPDGKGYWLVASDGGIFTFGDAGFYGSMGGHPLNKPIVGMAATPDGLGYWEVASDGGIFTFGDAGFSGSMGGQSIPAPVVAIAATDVTSLVAPGATGYDISNWQCGNYPPQAPLYVVEISGWPYSQTTPTSCLQSEVAWGGQQTQFYIFMGDNTPIPAGAPAPPPCPAGLSQGDCAGWQDGYSQAAYAYGISQNAGVHSSVWWLDVETSASSWSSSQSQNYQAILGAMAALKSNGALVGVYSTYLQWPEIAGPSAALPSGTPIWVADWNTSSPSAACAQATPFGGGFLAQVQTLPTNFDNDVSC